MHKAIIAIFLVAAVGFDPGGGPVNEGCAFAPACDPCHHPGMPPLPPGWGWGPHGEIVRC